MTKIRRKYSLICKKCNRIFFGQLPSIRYCNKCRIRVCKNCGKTWKLYGAITKHAYDYCSKNCSSKATMKKLWNNNSFKKKMTAVGINAGKRLTKKNVVETTHPRWKGQNCSYSSLHHWVRKHLGSAKQCSKCGKFGKGKQIHWANISGIYKRNLSDWKQLCVKCHSDFDNKRKTKKVF